jgi:hypothetical protein
VRCIQRDVGCGGLYARTDLAMTGSIHQRSKELGKSRGAEVREQAIDTTHRANPTMCFRRFLIMPPTRQVLDFQLNSLDLGLGVATRIRVLRCVERFFLDVLVGAMARHEAAERQLMVRWWYAGCMGARRVSALARLD